MTILPFLQGGKFYYIEHVCAEEKTWTYSIQKRLTPIWKHVADGCHLDRTTWSDVDAAGFTDVNQERFIAPFERYAFMIRPHLIGVATK